MAERVKGEVKFYLESKGFGFLKVPDTPDIFVHVSTLKRAQIPSPLLEGDVLEFEIVAQEGKGPKAEKLKLLERGGVRVNAEEKSLYLEAHVTISPVFDAEREAATALAARHKFKLAHLVMLKDKGPDQPSQRDTFMTGHSDSVSELAERTRDLVRDLVDAGFAIWRYKIESCVLDSRQQGDPWGVLDPDRPELPLIACDGCSVL